MSFAPLSVRHYGLIASAIVLVFSWAILHFRPGLERNPPREDRFCRYLFICADNGPAQRGFQSLREGGTQAIDNSVVEFRAALQRDHASSFRWCDLGEAYLASGDLPKARYCFSRGLQLAPNSPIIQLRVANFHLREGDTQVAMSYMSRLLKSTPAYDELIFSYYDRLGFGGSEVLQHGIPADRRAGNAWFYHQLKAGNPRETTGAWNWVSSHSFSDDRQASSYVDGLIKQGQYASAAQAWTAYLAGRPGPVLSNLLLNGSFEEQPTGTVFDWKIEGAEGAQAERDCNVAYSGKCSLRIHFEAKDNLAYRHVSQTIVIKPGAYMFEAYVRADDITTDRGVGFRIFDIENPTRLNVVTNAVTGSSNWKAVRQTFTVPSETRVVTVQVVRSPSQKFENRIKGTVWLDRMAIVPSTHPAYNR